MQPVWPHPRGKISISTREDDVVQTLVADEGSDGGRYRARALAVEHCSEIVNGSIMCEHHSEVRTCALAC